MADNEAVASGDQQGTNPTTDQAQSEQNQAAQDAAAQAQAAVAQAQAAIGEGEADEYQYDIKIEDVSPGTKKIQVTIPEDRIADKLKEQFKELRQQAAIPGFRPGHAPQKLIEKRFNTDVREQVRGTLIRESYEQAVTRNNLQILGEPEFGDAEKIVLPETGPLTYAVTVEVQPEFALPPLQGLKLKKPKIEVTSENIEQAMLNLREQQGILVPVEDRGVEPKDYLVADVQVLVDGNMVVEQRDAQMVSRPGRISGIAVEDLDKQLQGMKPGENRTIKAKAPETHTNEALRGKDVEIVVSLKDIKRLELAEVNADFLKSLGFTTEQELRDALREQMIERLTYDVQQAMRDQIHKYLLDNTQIELPAKMSDRQVQRVAGRRAVDMMMRGGSIEQVQSQLDELRENAKDEAIRELKLYFILQKVAAEQNVDVEEGELNNRIAMIAIQRGRRPEKLKQDMAKDGSLTSLYLELRDQKAVDRIIAQAEVEEVAVAETAPKQS